MKSRLLLIVAVVLTSACTNPKQPYYTLTAPSSTPAPTPTPTPTPPPPPLIQPLSVSLSVGPGSPRKNNRAAFSAFVLGLQGPGSFAWDFGDGITAVTTTDVTLHTYLDDGQVTASVLVTEESGRSATASVLVTIRDELQPPQPPPQPPIPLPTLEAVLTCTARAAGTATPCNVTVSYSGSVLASVLVTDVDWDWGDGMVTENVGGPLATHVYAQAGSYTVWMKATATTIDGPKAATISRLLLIP